MTKFILSLISSISTIISDVVQLKLLKLKDERAKQKQLDKKKDEFKEISGSGTLQDLINTAKEIGNLR